MVKQVQLLTACLLIAYLSFGQTNIGNNHGEGLGLCHKPDGGDFVTTNNNRLLTSTLYGIRTALRIDTGDRPEFTLYMPDIDGNYKFSIGRNNQSKWLTQPIK